MIDIEFTNAEVRGLLELVTACKLLIERAGHELTEPQVDAMAKVNGAVETVSRARDRGRR